MKPILIITPYNKAVGGVETVTETLIEVLQGLGYAVEKLTADNLSPQNFYEKLMVKIIGLPYLTGRAFKRKNPENYSHVICNGEYSWGIEHQSAFTYFHGSYLGLRNYSANKSWRTFLVLSWRAYLQKKAAQGTKVIAVSEFLKNILAEQGIKTDYVISNPIDLKKYHPKEKEKSGDYVFVGRFDYFAKGFDVLEALAKKNHDLSVYSFGEKIDLPLQFKTSSSSDFNDVYNNYKMLIFPSRLESFGMVPAEAMAAGLPVLMHEVGIGQELKKTIPQYIVDDFFNDRKLAGKIDEIKKNYAHYSQESRKYAENHFSLEKFKENWMKILNA